MGERYVLIDGHSLAYRAFFALPADLATSSGQTTNAVYGFVSMLSKVLEELKPQAVVVAFDKGKPQFRLEQFEEYKAGRKPMPDSLREQMEIIHAVLDALRIPYLEEEGYEADDILATVTDMLPGDAEVFIVTGDRDALQLVSERVKVVANRKGITDIVVYDPGKVKERYGVLPEQVVDYLALKGDSSDNIPGVPGIGEKTAAALINQYGSLEEIYRHLQDIGSPKLRKALEENRETAFLSRELARMRRDAGLTADPREWRLKPWDEEEARRLFELLEFRKLYRRLEELYAGLFGARGEGRAVARDLRAGAVHRLAGGDELTSFLRAAERAGQVAVYPRLVGEGFSRGDLAAVSFAVGEEVYHLAMSEGGGRDILASILRAWQERPGLRIDCYRGKELMVQCHKECGLMPECDFDVQLASYLLNPSGTRHELEEISRRHLGITLEVTAPGQLDLLGEGAEAPLEDAARALAVGRLVEPMEAEMNMMGLTRLFREVEIPLQRVLADMEVCGVRLDIEALRSMEQELQEELADLERRACQMAGEPFNLNSPQQLAHVLFEVLELPPVKRTKTGYATDVSVLESLKDRHPIVEVLLRYRELSKLLGTYVAALPRLVDPRTGRLHACFNQVVTATGRLSSSNPNLQNIPVRTPLGKSIRRAFVPTWDDGWILAADYSQIELRILAHLSGDPGLRRAFEEGRDIHAATACEVFGISPREVTEEHRRRAKAINFGIIYGMSPYGLAEQLGIEPQEAEVYISNYFKRFPGVRLFLDRTVEEALQTGYVTTLMGRRREIPELREGNLRLRRLGERLAFNTPIQGSAADIIKVAMIGVHRRLREEGMRSRLLLQVHDELVLEVEGEEAEAVEALVREEMEGAFRLEVPLVVETGLGRSWYEAK